MTSFLKHALVWIVMVCMVTDVFPQTMDYQLPRIAPQAPAVANFMRYGEIPVNHSTGVPDISIPLHVVTSRKLSLPIGISYHASGIKVNDWPSVVGLGWVLNAGGIVGVSILGGGSDGATKPTYKTPDTFKAQRNLVKENLEQCRAFGGLIETERLTTDWESDRYSVQLPDGRSGTFTYDYLSGDLIMLSYKPWKVEKVTTYHQQFNRDILTGLIITDEGGTAYTFNARWPDGTVQGFYLTSMISADKTDTIRLEYKQEPNTYWTYSHTSVIDIGMNMSLGDVDDGVLGNDCQFSNSGGSPTISVEPILDRIISSATVVRFISVGDRTDQAISQCPYRITQMVVEDRFSGQQVKSVAFNQGYFGTIAANNQRLKLNGISIGGNSGSTADQHYNFTYETGVELPPFTNGYGPTFSEDFWGYYNGQGATSLVHGAFVPASYNHPDAQGIPAVPQLHWLGNRSPDHTLAKAYLIKEIQYPTGGKTVFDFEPNYALAYEEILDGPPVAGNTGGFRIQKISNYLPNGLLSGAKRYEYSPGVTRVIRRSLYRYERRTVYLQGYATIRIIITSNPLLNLTAENGPPVFYENVTEYNIDGANQNTGKTVYTYKTPPAEYHAPWVIPEQYGIAPVLGPWAYPFGYFDDLTYKHSRELERGNYQPLLLTKTDYRLQASTYIPVAKLEQAYTSFLPGAYYVGMSVNFATNPINHTFDYHWCTIPVPGLPAECNSTTMQAPFYMYPIALNATQEFELLTRTKNYTYSPDGLQMLAGTTDYTYGSLANYTLGNKVLTQPTEQTVVNSKNEALKTEFKYASDFATAPYTTLVNRNSLNQLVEQKSYKDATLLQSIKTNYKSWAPATVIEPEYIQVTKGGAATETRLRYHSRDGFGNTKSVSAEDDIKQSYLYDYNNTQPVAQVLNANDSEIAYTSFEADSKGGWNYTQAARANDISVKTGKYYYRLAQGNITRSLTPGKYKLEFWTKTGTVNLSGGTITAIFTSTPDGNGWTLHQREITIASNTTLTIFSSTNSLIDEVRLYPMTAQMTSYTFIPAVGISSVTDPNGMISYYEYDSYGRLQIIRDDKGNIVKAYEYHYQK